MTGKKITIKQLDGVPGLQLAVTLGAFVYGFFSRDPARREAIGDFISPEREPDFRPFRQAKREPGPAQKTPDTSDADAATSAAHAAPRNRTATRSPSPGPATPGTSSASVGGAAPSVDSVKSVNPTDEALLATLTHDMRNLGAYVCIDSNLWMNQANEPFLRAFVAHTARAGVVLTLPGEQHEEIKHIKDSPERDDAQRARARHADRLIASVCAAGNLVIGETRDRHARRDFDGYLAKRAATELKARRSAGRVIVFTEDVQLTARLHSERTKAKAGAHQVRVFDARDFVRLAALTADDEP